ncbi:MAG: glycosyltransferase family 39 protein [Nitrospirae bacterium]|nr:glycosyltransferase family 39 protein [Nitrospirota bacterium]
MQNRRTAVLAAFAVFLALFQLGGFTLFDVDEAVFSEASREMLETGDWLTPTYNYENRYDKPIFFYWLQASSLKLFGVNELAARLPSAIAGLALLGLIYAYVRHVASEITAFWSAAALLLSLEFITYSHAAVTDMTLSLFITASILSFHLSTLEPEKRRYLLGFYAGSALAFLTKGLIGIIFPWTIAILYSAAKRRFNLRRLLDPAGIALFLAIGLPWYVLEFSANGMEFFNALFLKHHVSRFLKPNSGHSGSVFYYVPVLVAGFFPWIALLPRAIWRAFRDGGDTRVLASVWFVFVVVFFSFSNTKLPNYILSAFPAAAILAGSRLAALEKGESARPEMYAIIALSLAFGAAFTVAPSMLAEKGAIIDGLLPVAAAFIAVSLACAAWLLSGRRFPVTNAIGGAMCLLIVLVLWRVLPSANRELQGELHDYTIAASAWLGRDGQLATYGINNPSVAFYRGGKVLKPGSAQNWQKLKERGRAVVITSPSRADEVAAQGFEVFSKGRRFTALRHSSALP